MLVSLTVGKVDAGVTVLLTPDKRLIEFPSILLPPDIESGSIVDIMVSRNTASEVKAESLFRALQDQIYNAFGAGEPAQPVLRCRNATQTSVVLEWDPVQLATADLISLALYRNGQKAGNIPRPLDMHSTKISGLAVDTEYTFHLVLRTTAGTLASEKVTVRTHKMTDLSGVTITTGIMPAVMRENLAKAVDRVGARMVDGVRIDTTHFVTTEGRGMQWEKAVEMNIPVVRPEWVEACEKNGRILGVTKFYLDAMRPVPGTLATSEAPSPVTQKELPQPPAGAGAGAAGAGAAAAAVVATSGAGDSGEENKYQQIGSQGGEDEVAAQKKEMGDQESVSSEDSDDDESEKETEKTSAQEEQKSRAEEKDIPFRPTALAPTRPFDEDAGGGPEDSKATTPGDGASFQDVAL
ncbi:hypothetical protein GGTG_11651 [Gaeumannomyces tritici R3-111a-1]|uniref:Chitin biosynthesis protein CHS5 n=1 Tax=Gaeumannomyces tritici (strain R3-111a-1) TaxID=644352 RepID=J3PDS8_GAET3|nr:hypothetical protein GGTG_11651 [Gaeumannomyces tritici R3-111a-1]EJT70628.1 hypothetical protein GGTG_11651 [Gaeumannomyces tritici R3-111a-1]